MEQIISFKIDNFNIPACKQYQALSAVHHIF